jgi:hypothetical protein
MPTLHISHGVRDYDAWKQAFDSDPIDREAGGVSGYRIMRGVDDPNYVVIQLDFDEAGKAESFQTALEGLWGRMGDELGLEGPKARILETTETGEH